MDPNVFSDPNYADQMDAALRDIPSMSLVVDLPDLFDEQTGIYMNGSMRGREWERPCSLEMLNPDGSPGFQANAGVRLRGGFSRRDSNPKHALRFYFRGDYGTPKLEFPLFGSEGVDKFDKIDLRTSQNYGWQNSPEEGDLNTMNRDVFSRDLQAALGQPYTRSRYYHLYINGVYWGLYQSQERAEARFAETYFGGDKDDYDVIKVDTPGGHVIEATDGTTESWEAIWTATQGGFETDEKYFALEGKSPSGTRDPLLPVLVDIDNLIDYLLIVFYTGNYDAPVSKFFANQEPNNFYAINDRLNLNEGFRFFSHDAEHSLHVSQENVGTGLYENRVSIAEPGQALNAQGVADPNLEMQVTQFAYFHPQWLHHRLSENSKYRARFALRARALLGAGGPMTPALVAQETTTGFQ
jgi:hypothetical protein